MSPEFAPTTAPARAVFVSRVTKPYRTPCCLNASNVLVTTLRAAQLLQATSPFYNTGNLALVHDVQVLMLSLCWI